MIHQRQGSGRARLLLWILSGCVFACGTPEPSTPANVAPTGVGPEAAEGAAAAQDEAVQSAEPTGPLPPQALEAYQQGQQAFANADLPGARAHFERALQQAPRAPQVHLALGNLAERSGDISGAARAYTEALDASPGFAPAIEAKTRLLLAADRADQAEAFAREVLVKSPDSAAALSALAEVRSVRGDSSEAQQLAQRALKKDPDYRPAMVVLARDHYRARRLDLALYTLTAILDGYGEENPPRDRDNVEAHYLRALIYKEQSKRVRAMEELSRVLELRPDMVAARLHLAAYMLAAGNAEGARPVLEKALDFEPMNVLVHLNLGDAYRLLGKPKDALEHLEWVSRRDESLAQAHYNLGLVYLFAGEIPGKTPKEAINLAIASFEQFKKLKPRAGRGQGDDVDELLSRARNKLSIMVMMEQEMSDESEEVDGESSGEGSEGTEGGGDGWEDDGWE